MKRAATQLFKRQSKNRAFFKIIELLLRCKTHRARQRSENPTPGATRMCESPEVARGGGRSGLELTDTLAYLFVFIVTTAFVVEAPKTFHGDCLFFPSQTLL